MTTPTRKATFGALLILAALAVTGRSHTEASDDCLACHEDASLTMTRGGRSIRLHVDPAMLRGSTHSELSCTDCHSGIDLDELPHGAAPVDCLGCHDDSSEAHTFHPPELRGEGPDAVFSCSTCHGAHAIAPLDDETSGLRSRHQIEACGACHEPVVEQYSGSEHGRSFAAGQPGAPSCLDCHRRPVSNAHPGGGSAEHKILQEKLCLSCHLDDPEVRARMTPEAGFISAYEGSVHGLALLNGVAAAATCVDCHGSHEMRRGLEPESRVSRPHIPGTCGTCHVEILETYNASVHGAAVAHGNPDAPVCTDCHSEHNIRAHLDPDSPVAPGNVSLLVCSPCHTSVRLSEKYGIASDRFRTFSDSYHGLALRGGAIEVANCASCHGAHDILPLSDASSSIHKDNLAATCERCHPGANERFTVGDVHVAVNGADTPLLYWIATAYVALIVLVVGGMLVHNILDFVRKAAKRLRIRHGREIEEAHGGSMRYLRMTLSERIQHATLLISFTLLVVTGFMLHYPEAWWVVALRRLNDDLFELRSLLHRVAGAAMIVASVYHLIYVSVTARGHAFLRDILPRRDDLRDLLAMMGYYLGLSRHRPRFGRFGYVEKSEYWALVWGTFLMGATGVILWFENTFIGLLTKLGWDVARTVHFYEAWLATLAILVWHIYYVVFNPEVYPMNTAWITGTLSEAEMAEEHPLELEALRKKQREEEARAREAARASGEGDDGGSS